MSANLRQAIEEQVRVLSEDEVKQVFDFMQGLRKDKKLSRAKPISAVFEELSNQVPLETWRELPSDGAENHDHYLYGAPKKSR
jgi:hypothetical protein